MRNQTIMIFLLVFFGGFANLAAEIIGPRMFASIFGDSTSIWAVIISVTLVGLSIGYAAGGQIAPGNVEKRLPVILTVNALWLLTISWLVWRVPAEIATAGAALDLSVIMTMASAAFFVPSVLFGMLSPMAISLLSIDAEREQFSQIVGIIYAIGTIGSVAGALSAAFFLIPWVGLSLSLRIFALLLVAFATYFYQGRRKVIAAGTALVVLVAPQPDFLWANTEGLTLLDQRESAYQTVRVYTDDETFVQMHLGPTFQSKMDLETGEPAYDYAIMMRDFAIDYVEDMEGVRVLVIGGAGHNMARALENRGAVVTEAEIDPVVIELSDRYFGPIEGDVVNIGGRAFVEIAETDSYDLVLFDAFDSGVGIPPQLISREFFAELDRILTADGVVLYNFVGSAEGRRSGAYRALSATMSSVFEQVGATVTEGEERQNIIFVASQTALDPLPVEAVPRDTGILLTDERNPVEMLLEQARTGLYYRQETTD